MPRLAQVQAPTTKIEFVVSVPLDLLNCMYFTSLVPQIEGVEGWPVQLRREMAPDLLQELDYLYNYPAGDPGLMGMLGDMLIAHPEAWASVDALVDYVRSMPDGIGDYERAPGIQGLIHQTTFRFVDATESEPYADLSHREAVYGRMRDLPDRDETLIMAVYDRPSELRERMARLIERFYRDHYAAELPNRLSALERSAASHRADATLDPAAVARKLTGRSQVCLEGHCAGPWRKVVFMPSADMGPYSSCAIVDGVHGMFYQLEPEFLGAAPDEAEEVRLARIYKALSDEQRLRILRMLRDEELYAQEIVERTGLHQSVVSRHLSFMKAVGLLNFRKVNNMKYYSLNPAVTDQLASTIALFAPAREGGPR